MVDWMKRIQTQLQNEDPLPVEQIVTKLRQAFDGPTAWLGSALQSAAAPIGQHGERCLLVGDGRAWGLLAAARRARSLGVLLAPVPIPLFSATMALSILEALQWEELAMARRVGALLELGLKGLWSMNRLSPSKSELEALAMHFLTTIGGQHDLVAADTSVVPLDAFAAAAGTNTDLSLGEGFAIAVDEYWELCRDSGYVPRGARLSAAPVLACVSCRMSSGELTDSDIQPVWDLVHPSLRQYRNHLGTPIDPELSVVLNDCAGRVAAADPR